MSSGQFEDAPEDHTLDSAIPADSFVALNGANTALPLPGSTKATGTGTRARQSGVGYIDEVEEVSRSPSSPPDEGEVSFQRLHLGSQVSNEPVPSDDEEPVDLSGEDEENYDVEIDDEDWEVADSDFTKQYNRMRQQKAALSTSQVPLPARNAGAARLRSSAASSSSSTTNPAKLAPAPLSGVSSAPKAAYTKANQKDKADRATQEQVLDPRTKSVLASLVRKGLVCDVGGCVSTGKEANVYHGTSPTTPPISTNPSSPYPDPYPASIALKVYKTSILSFKTRSAYMVGDNRLKNSYTAVSNPRKMVRTWAEKELRNLRRLWNGGVKCPVVVDVRENVLVMEFLGGVDGSPSPRLKDATITKNLLPDLYAELLIAMRRMYHTCRLVHADLSEYNILYHDSHLYIIDVSQSVEHDHPSSFDFLRKDIQNVNDYFVRKSGGETRILGGRGVFEFVVNERLDGVVASEDGEDEDDLKEVIRRWLEKGVGLIESDNNQTSNSTTSQLGGEVVEGDKGGKQNNAGEDDKVFMSSYIPRSLAEVYDPERDMEKKTSELIYSGVTGLGGMGKKAEVVEEAVKEEKVAERTVRFEGEVEDESEENTEDEDSEEDDGQGKPRGFRHESKEDKKERKKALKEEMREKRKTKMPKAEKARAIKKGGHGK